MGGFSQYGQTEPEASRWRPLIIAAVVIVIVVAIAWLLSRSTKPPAKPSLPTYAQNLQTGDLALSTAQNFVGANVTYIQGRLANSGDKTVTDAAVETVFRNNLGEIVDRQTQALRVAASPLGNPDWVPLSRAPLLPGKSVQFRLVFEHISADWNMGYPELRFVQIATR